MTLLLALYTSSGIVFASDSAITVQRPTAGEGRDRAPKQEKFIRVGKLGETGGFVGFFGLARTRSGREMAVWLRQTVDGWPGSRRAENLGVYLCEKLNRATDPVDRHSVASGFYIGTFERRDGFLTPVFQYVWNYADIDPVTGEYLGMGDYQTGEHFPRNHDDWNDVAPRDMRRRLRAWEQSQGVPFWLRNGELALAARTQKGLEWAIGATVTLPRFRLPESIEGWQEIADMLVRTNGRLMKTLLARGAPTVEGPYRTQSLPWP